MGIINFEFKEVSVRESMTYGQTVFPDKQWPQVSVQFQTYESLIEMSNWCDLQFGYQNWYRVGSRWLFNDQDSKMLFELTWT